MITGHFGVAAALRSGWPRTSLLWLFAGSIAPDLLDVVYAVLGVCSPHGLYSHTVPIVALLALLFGVAAGAATRSSATALATALVVLLHLPPDLVTGHKYFWPGTPLIGLGLYGWPLADFVVEATVLTTGWWLLRRAGAAPRWAVSVRALVLLLVLQGAADLAGVPLKPTACERVDQRA